MIAKLPLLSVMASPSIWLLASIIETLLPGSAVPEMVVPSTLTSVMLGAAGGVRSTMIVGAVAIGLTLPAASVC
ncbi:hypothetical protein D3C80_2167400 [compost metagenome]